MAHADFQECSRSLGRMYVYHRIYGRVTAFDLLRQAARSSPQLVSTFRLGRVSTKI